MSDMLQLVVEVATRKLKRTRNLVSDMLLQLVVEVGNTLTNNITRNVAH